MAYTQPKLTTIGKKKPDFFELGIGGNVNEKLTYAKEILGKEIKITDVFNEGQFVDSVSITKGKGFQGPVKRFGVMLRHHKSEKSRRNAGSLGPWHGHRQYRVPKAGQTGFQQRRESNKYIVKIDDDVEAINSKAGFLRYGVIRNSYVLIKGSLSGSSKRLITLIAPQRKPLSIGKEAPTIVHISTTKQ